MASEFKNYFLNNVRPYYFNENEIERRENLIDKLSKLLKLFMTSKGYRLDDLSQVTLECFGSFALKICTKESDVDLAAIIEQKFENIKDELFYDEFVEYLLENDSISIEDYRVIKKARVPIIKLFIDGIEIDITLVRPCSNLSNTDLGSRKYIQGMNEISIKSVSGLRDFCCVKKFMEINGLDINLVRNIVSIVKHWTISKGIYGRVLGFFSTPPLIVMVLKILTKDRTVDDLESFMELFLSTFSKWNWQTPVSLQNPYNDPPEHIKNMSEIKVHTLSIPTKNSMCCSKSSRAIIKKVFSTSAQDCFERLFEKKNWINEYNHFILVTSLFESKKQDKNTSKDFNDWTGFVRSRIFNFSLELENLKDENNQNVFNIIHPILNYDSETFFMSDSPVWLLGLEFACNFQMNHLNLSQPTRAFTRELKQLATERDIYKTGMKVKIEYSNKQKLNRLGIIQ